MNWWSRGPQSFHVFGLRNGFFYGFPFVVFDWLWFFENVGGLLVEPFEPFQSSLRITVELFQLFDLFRPRHYDLRTATTPILLTELDHLGCFLHLSNFSVVFLLGLMAFDLCLNFAQFNIVHQPFEPFGIAKQLRQNLPFVLLLLEQVVVLCVTKIRHGVQFKNLRLNVLQVFEAVLCG